MIVFLFRMALVLVWTIIAIRELKRLRRERLAATHQGRTRDPYTFARNRRAVILLALWSATVPFGIGGLTYISPGFTDLARITTTAEGFMLLALGLTLWHAKE